jgi:hypothetical protein
MSGYDHDMGSWTGLVAWSGQSTHTGRRPYTVGGSLLLCIHHYLLCNVGHGSETTATDYEAVNQCAK